MTWNKRAILRARWAKPQEVSRELSWLTVGPSTASERGAFAVEGPGQLSGADLGREDHLLAGGLGGQAGGVGEGALAGGDLVDTTSGTCVASSGDFSPKRIEQALYSEGDAPALDAGSTLELSCTYRNGGEDSVAWGSEGEATVWGRKERCSAVVFYYPAAAR